MHPLKRPYPRPLSQTGRGEEPHSNQVNTRRVSPAWEKGLGDEGRFAGLCTSPEHQRFAFVPPSGGTSRSGVATSGATGLLVSTTMVDAAGASVFGTSTTEPISPPPV